MVAGLGSWPILCGPVFRRLPAAGLMPDKRSPSNSRLSSTLDASHAQLSRWRLWLRNFWPAPVRINRLETLRMALGIALGLLVTAWASRWWGGAEHPMWLASSLGASAVLLFGMPASPMAQPWPVLGGTVLSALVGAACQYWIPDTAIACAAAVGVSVALMVPLRCLHPPGAGFAAFVVLEHVNGAQLIVFPIMFNLAMLLLCALIYNALTGRRYPHPQHSVGADQAAHFVDADLDAALNHYNQVLDISRADLAGLLDMAGRAAFKRTLGDLRCTDIMSAPVFAVEPGVPVKEAWALMRQEEVKALPVVDADNRVIGMISMAEFMRQANLDVHEGLGQRLRHLVLGRNAHKGRVQEVMEVDLRLVPMDLPVVDLVPLFSSAGVHHLVVVDAQQHLVGIISQTDLIRTLSNAISLPVAAAGG